MIKMRRISLLALLLCICMTFTAFASEWSWESAPGHHDQSVLLDEAVTVSKDAVYGYARGDNLAEGSVELSNNQDGTFTVIAMTLAHRNVDEILHSIYIDIWNEEENDWIQVDHWDISKTKEETESGELYMLTTTISLTGYKVGEYYRLRGLHGVVLNDELEACATETDGVKLTDWRDW